MLEVHLEVVVMLEMQFAVSRGENAVYSVVFGILEYEGLEKEVVCLPCFLKLIFLVEKNVTVSVVQLQNVLVLDLDYPSKVGFHPM